MARRHIIDTVDNLISITNEIKEQNDRIIERIIELSNETKETNRINEEQLTQLRRINTV